MLENALVRERASRFRWHIHNISSCSPRILACLLIFYPQFASGLSSDILFLCGAVWIHSKSVMIRQLLQGKIDWLAMPVCRFNWDSSRERKRKEKYLKKYDFSLKKVRKINFFQTQIKQTFKQLGILSGLAAKELLKLTTLKNTQKERNFNFQHGIRFDFYQKCSKVKEKM